MATLPSNNQYIANEYNVASEMNTFISANKAQAKDNQNFRADLVINSGSEGNALRDYKLTIVAEHGKLKATSAARDAVGWKIASALNYFRSGITSIIPKRFNFEEYQVGKTSEALVSKFNALVTQGGILNNMPGAPKK
ncbi:hypothetical protein SOPP22_02600 [Shewanella sp. OPT22]|nr:hypothetical protein SOPP22_02600 [Shewanella sp. OPT22]